jgi:hydroxyethylthiazole kinase
MQHPDIKAREDVVRTADSLVACWRGRSPKVHCITNVVAQHYTANALLAVGAIPSMTLSAEEIGAFVTRAQSLLVNLGTFDPERRAATQIAVDAAIEHHVPWVLDPVFIDRSPSRAAFARELVTRSPAVVRLNAAEFVALSDAQPTPEALAAYARDHGLVVALSGETDLVTDGTRLAAIANGHPLMAKVTAMGCAGSALVAAALAVEQERWRVAAAALLIMGVAGEVAAAETDAPGSFGVAMIDALYRMDDDLLRVRARVS